MKEKDDMGNSRKKKTIWGRKRIGKEGTNLRRENGKS